MVVTVVLGLGAAFLQVASSTTRRQVQATHTKNAFYLAEAGIAEAYAGLLVGKTGNVGTEEMPAVYGDGLFWVDATDNPDTTKSLVATGMYGTGRAVLSIVVAPGSPNLGALGLFADRSLQIGSGSLIDAYDSRHGTYAEYQAASGAGAVTGALGAVGGLAGSGGLGGILGGGGGGEEGSGEGGLLGIELGSVFGLPAPKPVQVGSNTDASIAQVGDEETVVQGDLRVGPGEALAITGSPEITGTTAPLEESEILPALQVPATPLDPGVRHTSPVPLLIQDGVAGLGYLEVAPNATVVLQGPLTLVLDDLTVEPLGELFFDTSNGGIAVFVTDDLEVQGGALVGQSAGTDPGDVTLLSSGSDPVLVASDGPMVGVLYAPEASITVDGTEFFGAVVGKDVHFTGGAALHYDQALAAVSDASALPHCMTWRIIDLAPMKTATVTSDPFALLGVDPLLCPSPAQAHEDQMLAITYVDSGATLTYEGLESGFDWTRSRRWSAAASASCSTWPAPWSPARRTRAPASRTSF